MAALDQEEFAYLPRCEAPSAATEALTRVHSAAHVAFVLDQIPRQGRVHIDADTSLSSGSGEAALRAAGAAVLGADLIAQGRTRSAFCAVRPPGHHAEPERAMGFCLFNNVAIGAYHARAVHGFHRLAIIDFDVHHGNGTQALAMRDPDLFYASTHQWPLYPGTGGPNDHGPAANIVNVPLRAGTDGPAFRQAFAEIIVPALDRFRPDMLFISAGFDAHWRDPLANLDLTEQDFGWVTAELVKLAERHCQGRILSTLEGGYDLDALRRSAEAHVRALMA